MKGDMEVEVLTEPSDAGRAKQRMSKIVMSAEEKKLYCGAPNAARGNDHPACPDD
mgnify:FL=1